MVIHVCDENRQIKRDFVCKREILVSNMKYFESFLSDNENGYDDIDISVHCDVDIFEWLMAFIHEPDQPPKLDKTIVVSILISSEFLQMDSLVDLCLEHISKSLGDIIKLPIDLSCISEKMINKLAFLIPPKVLAQTRDRKDKILNKLYKRRVELDFSRKAGSKGGTRSIAASLTCCQHCGRVYLEMFEKKLSCTKSAPFVDFRGRLVRRHMAISGWSLTAYLKALHAGGMSWESIYWHVWATCQVFECGGFIFSALDTNLYKVDEKGILLVKQALKKENVDEENSEETEIDGNKDQIHPQAFTLSRQDDLVSWFETPASSSSDTQEFKLGTTIFDEPVPNPYITSTLNPNRPPHILDVEIFELLTSQMKYIAGAAHRQLIDSTGKNMAAAASNTGADVTFEEVLWAGRRNGRGNGNNASGVGDEERGRSRSPTGMGTSRNQSRRHTTSVGAKASQNSGTAGDSDGSRANEKRSAHMSNKEGILRSRSSSAGTRRVNGSIRGSSGLKSSSTSSGKPLRNPTSGASAESGATDGRYNQGQDSDNDAAEVTLDIVFFNNLRIMKGMPPHLTRANSRPGPVDGIWLETHPLQIGPASFNEAYAALKSLNLSDRRRAEWEVDMMRDIDQKRMDRLEQFLVSNRDTNVDLQLRAPLKKLRESTYGLPRKRVDRRTGKYSYYRDKGRQPIKKALD